MSKLYIKDGTPIPEDGNCFIVAGNGVFVRKRTGWVDAIVRVDAIDGLLYQEEHATLLLPVIPGTVFWKAILFFADVYKKMGTEAAVLLHYSDKLGWDITVPVQTVTGISVDYDATERLPGYRCVGTMHSHGRLPAFHSSTDIYDEANADGIHITIGLLQSFPHFGMDAEFVVNGHRFPLPEGHISRLETVEDPRRALMRALDTRPADNRYALYTMPLDILPDWEVPVTWLERVIDGRGWTFAETTDGITQSHEDASEPDSFEENMKKELR